MPSFLRVGALSGSLYLPFLSLFSNAQAADTDTVQRGRYRVQVAGCNDCHTAGYILARSRFRKAPGSPATNSAGAAPGAPPTQATCAWPCKPMTSRR